MSNTSPDPHSPNNIQPGCLCLIIGCPRPDIIGTQCTAIQPHPSGDIVRDSADGYLFAVPNGIWQIELPDGQRALIEKHNLRRIDNYLPERDELSEILPALQRPNTEMENRNA